MIKRWLLIIGFFLFADAHSYTLEQNYTYDDPLIDAKSLFPELTVNFEIMRIPEDKTRYRIDSNVIAKTFELHGIVIDTAKTRYVNFTKKSHLDLSPLKKQVEHLFLTRYPEMNIRTIDITPRGYLEALPVNVRAVFDEKSLQSNSGIFYFQDQNAVRRYLDYKLDAILPVLHTTQDISRRDPLTGYNTLLKPVPFTVFRSEPLTRYPDQPHRYRGSLKENTMITERNIEKMPLVLRNQRVVCQIRNSSVVVEITAIAMQEGGLYDIISIQKNDGRRVKAKIVGENRVELQ